MQYMMIIKSNAATEAEVPMDTAFEQADERLQPEAPGRRSLGHGRGFQASDKGARFDAR